MLRSIRTSVALSVLALAGLALACSDASRGTGPSSPSFSSNNGRAYAYGHYRLVECRTRHPHEASIVIGPTGGVLAVGPDQLKVPAGALDQPTLLTGTVLPIDEVNVEFGPEGLQFEVPAQLTLNTTNCAIPAGVTPTIVYVRDGVITEVIPSVFDLVHHKITGPIHHFSGYSVAFADDAQ